jgi:hypothetical protein
MKYGAVLALLAFFSLPVHASESRTMASAVSQTGPAPADSAQTGALQADVPPDETLILGLTGPQLAAGVTIGAGLGAAAVAASGNTLAGAGLGTLAAIYVAHLLVEAVVVGGMYYLWPSEEEPSDTPSRKMPIRERGESAELSLPLQSFREASSCSAC